MNDPILVTDGTRPAVRLERHLPDPPPVVWDAITEREQLRSWFPCDVMVAGGRWEVGAAITFSFPPEVIEMTLTGEVLVFDPPTLLAYRWGEEILRFELTPEDGGTRLLLFDELPPEGAARNAAGWEDCLDRLAGMTDEREPWQRRFERYSAAFAPVIGPQSGPPPGYKGG